MTEKFFSHVLRAIVVWSFTKMSVLPPSERPGGGAEVVKEGNDGCRAGVCLQGESTGRTQKGGSLFFNLKGPIG